MIFTSKYFRFIFALTLAVGLTFLSLSLSPRAASAEDDFDGANVTFTKWLTVFPNMAGTIGGDVSGSYDGVILNTPDQAAPITVVEALYHFNTGGEHSFTARVRVTQDNQLGTAVIKGVVLEGWMKDAQVDGQYSVVTTCVQAAPGNLCFRGSLHLAATAPIEDSLLSGEDFSSE